jgi:hypothetical protein
MNDATTVQGAVAPWRVQGRLGEDSQLHGTRAGARALEARVPGRSLE